MFFELAKTYSINFYEIDFKIIYNCKYTIN
jgi:hypothetical protein